MSTRHVRRAQKLDWPGLNDLWSQIKARKTPGWPLGKALEHLILRAFELDGADVVWPYSVALGGETVEQIDGAVHIDGLSCLLECKDSDGAVNVEPIAKLRNQLLRRPSQTIGILVSRSGFTIPAQTLAQYLSPQTILLWSGEELAYLLAQKTFREALRKKYRCAIEQGLPDFDVRVEAIP